MDEGFAAGRLGGAARARDKAAQEGAIRQRLTPEPQACGERGGTTPTHPEPGRETSQRRRYWR